MKDTKIEWCDHSWSPWRGCTKVSPGCANCYAETLSKRNPAVLGQWGRGKPRVLAKNWGDPVKWNRDHQLNVDASHDGMYDGASSVLRVKRPTVFPSLCDWLDDEVPVEWLAKFLQLIHATPNLTWLLLTKRPELWEERIELVHRAAVSNGGRLIKWTDDWMTGTPPPNVWVGTSVEDQTRADERIPALLRIPAAGRFLSVEPLLGPVDLSRRHRPHSPDGRPLWPTNESMMFGFQWVIIGGESGRGARPCNVDWIRSLVRQCRDASAVPCFVKQVGSSPYFDATSAPCAGPMDIEITHPKGGDPAEWPEDLRVREFPEGLR